MTQSSEKDPNNTIERLTNSLQLIATSTESAIERYRRAWILLLPLREIDFPQAEDRAKIASIHSASPDGATDDQLGALLKAIWDLYWRMTENTMYR